MPAPEPGTVWVEEVEPGYFATFIQRYFWTGKAGNRAKRAQAIYQRFRLGDWCCAWCREPLHFDKRADARYCGESCRKKAARRRRDLLRESKAWTRLAS